MPPYHQGPFIVSSSPILPLDVQPIRPMRPAPLPLLSPPFDYPYRSPTCPSHPPALTPQAVRSIPSNWTDDATAVSLDIHGVCPQYRRSSPGTRTGLSPPHPPSRQLVNMPAGWDLPMDQGPYAPLPQRTEAGTTLFYRSPTPSARQRTNQACEKCRDRKTKCSGGRPCVRCQTRGLLCEYAVQHRVRGPAKARKRTSPSLDTPMSASRNRALLAHYHRYAPATPSVNSRINTAARTGWSLSDHSDESSDSSGAASFELSERTTYLGLSNVQGMDFISQQPRRELNPTERLNSRFQTMHRPAIDIKDQFITPTLRPSPSIPQPNPSSFQQGAPQSILATYSGNSYLSDTRALSKSFRKLTQESLHGCPSSSSRASQSHSSADDEQEPLVAQTHMLPNTIMPKNWPSTPSERRHPFRTEDSFAVGSIATDVEGETASSSSQTFNVSEWITGTDYCTSPERASSAVESVTPES